ncbi:MAG: alpha-galactosidase [Armatimonadetes bacterium]|nr:alpha-galactosidase [Armatimonadota bacterium]
MDDATLLFRTEPSPGLLCTSGLTLHDEALIDGRWVGRYWQGAGYVEPERLLGWIPEAAHVPRTTAGLDLAAFGLEVDGQSLHFGWEFVGYHDDGPGRGTVELRSTLRPITISLHTEVDGTGLLTRWLSITNTSDAPAALGAVWPYAGIALRLGQQGDWRPLLEPGQSPFRLGYFAEKVHLNEGAFEWLPLPSTPVRLESRTGKSGCGQPFFIVANEATGEHFVAGLAWSGNWAIELTAEYLSTTDAWLHVRLGPTAPAPQRVLAPGETVDTPAVHLGLLQLDFDAAIQAWHTHLRRSVLRPTVPGCEALVSYNHWGYVEHELTESGLLHDVDLAAEVGAEVLIVDAGWFGDQGSNWWLKVGDWRCGDRLPNGLEPVFERARARGLRCGLWFDCERLGRESAAALEHPEWLATTFGRPADWGDMDLTNPAALAWLEETLCRVIDRYQLDLFRLDYNTETYEGCQTQRAGYHENHLWRYYQAIDGLYRRLAARYPQMIMENCAGGGSRANLAMLGAFHHTQVSDWFVQPRLARIFNGLSIALPPERLELKAGVGMNGHIRGDLDTTIRGCFFGHLCLIGLAPDAERHNAAQLARVKHHVALYKRVIRPLLPDCRTYHHTPVLAGKEPRGWAVWEMVAADRTTAVAGLFRLGGPAEDAWVLRPRGLDLSRAYRVTLDNSGQSFVRDGAALVADGVAVRLARPISSEVVVFEAC